MREAQLVIERLSTEVLQYVSKPKWYNVELPEYEACLFRIFLRGLGVKFETSGAGFLTHFEIELLERSKNILLIDSFLEAL